MSDDRQPAFIDIVALAGGDESHLFVDMVLNMYRLWAYGNDRDFRLIEPSGTSALRRTGRAKLCIESADWRMLAARENGVHRLIRLPPGGSQRHTSFVGVRVSDSADTPLPVDGSAWGEQIRSLIVHPEQVLVNHRTGFRCRDIVGVMAGDLEQFWREGT